MEEQIDGVDEGTIYKERADTFCLDYSINYNRNLAVTLFDIPERKKYHKEYNKRNFDKFDKIVNIFKAFYRQRDDSDQLLTHTFDKTISNNQSSCYTVSKGGVIIIKLKHPTGKKVNEYVTITLKLDYVQNLTRLEQQLMELRIKNDIKQKERQKQNREYKRKYQQSLLTIQMEKQQNDKLFDIILQKQTEFKRVQSINKTQAQRRAIQQSRNIAQIRQKDQQIKKLKEQLQKYKINNNQRQQERSPYGPQGIQVQQGILGIPERNQYGLAGQQRQGLQAQQGQQVMQRQPGSPYEHQVQQVQQGYQGQQGQQGYQGQQRQQDKHPYAQVEQQRYQVQQEKSPYQQQANQFQYHEIM